jgi:hypothetical protein
MAMRALPLLIFAGVIVAQAPSAAARAKENPLLALLRSEKAVFGAFSGEKMKENAAKLSGVAALDSVFYDMDAAAVESAIQSVLSTCKELGVACGITAGPADIEKRLKEGFRVFILTNLDALPIGRRAASRGPAG